MTRCIGVAVVVLAVAVAVAAPANAQTLGLGPRVSFVRGNLTSGTPSTRLIGATLRFVTGPHTVLEGTMDYRSYYNEAGTERTRETPMTGSVLFYVARSTFSPYVGGGLGMYSQIHDTLDANGLVTSSTTEKKIGWHLGAGAEILFSKHAGIFVDYRFRFVTFGNPTNGDQEKVKIPGTTIFPVLDNVKLSHEGSQWTTGLSFYF